MKILVIPEQRDGGVDYLRAVRCGAGGIIPEQWGKTSSDLDPTEVTPLTCLLTTKSEEQESQMGASNRSWPDLILGYLEFRHHHPKKRARSCLLSS